MANDKSPRRKVARSFHYAWVEFATSFREGRPHADDGVAFQQGLRKAGGVSVFRYLRHPKKGARWVDDDHEILPIRAIGKTLMALPNDRGEAKKGGKPIRDPIFEEFKKKHGDAAFEDKIREQNEFLAEWLLAPGAKRHSKANTVLTTKAGADAYADFVGVSGHGLATGDIWWGGHHLFLGAAARGVGATVSLPFPKYVFIGTCNCGAKSAAEEFWQVAMRRPTPIRAFFGYADKYKGGGRMLKTFTANLRKGQTILEAWKDAHTGVHKGSWSALIHDDATGDTLKDLVKGTLTTLKPKGDIHFFTDANFSSGGEKIVLVPPDHTAFFFVAGGKRVGPDNVNDPGIGLFPGEKGFIELTNTKGTYAVGNRVRLIFFLYRESNTTQVDLNKLLAFGSMKEAKHTVLKDAGSTQPRVLELEFSKSVKKLKIPFTVDKDATKHFPADSTTSGGQTHGQFWIGIEIEDPVLEFLGFLHVKMQAHAVWLRVKP